MAPERRGARRVCAWCGTVEHRAVPGSGTTHGLCASCLERRMAGAERPGEAGDPPDTEEQPVERGTGERTCG